MHESSIAAGSSLIAMLMLCSVLRELDAPETYMCILDDRENVTFEINYENSHAFVLLALLCFAVRYEYRRKHVHREKMTPRRHVLAGLRRTIIAAGVVVIIVLALSTSQDNGNSVQQAGPSEVQLFLSIRIDSIASAHLRTPASTYIYRNLLLQARAQFDP